MWSRDSESGQRQVGSEGALLAGKADPLHRYFNLLSKVTKTGERLHSYPEHSRTPRIGKETKTLQLNDEGFELPKVLQDAAHFLHFRIGNLAQELERQMDAFWLGPTRVRRNGTEQSLLTAQCPTNCLREIDGDKSTHVVWG